MNTRSLLSLAAVLSIVACKKDAPPPPAPTINVVTVHAADYTFSAPDSIPAGVTTIQLVNTGPSIHHIQLIRIDSGRTFDSLAAAFRGPPGPPPRWMTQVPGPNAPAVGDTSRLTVTLEPGHYAMICFIPDTMGVPHFAKGMMKPLEVTAATGAMAAEPTADAEIHLTDYAFTESAPLTAGTHTIKIVNDATQPHEMFIARLDSGATAAQMATWGEHNLKGRAPHTVRAVGGTSGMMPGAHAFVHVNLTPGDYALICFAPDARDGKSHSQHGMVKQIHVS